MSRILLVLAVSHGSGVKFVHPAVLCVSLFSPLLIILPTLQKVKLPSASVIVSQQMAMGIFALKVLVTYKPDVRHCLCLQLKAFPAEYGS